ncbi:OmpA family protein [Methylophaga sp. OBS4]|uniref:OmpA family protein n=1 Tax=Methylophaga sp. OBS4 TaxID=2991935 RepID=UPI00224EF3FD|nr:OmpA family protein [Methylophaga sp. OBS4]MCX4187938.1 OmpA family protein [Methylophaga sp. OBS4]
MKLSGKLLAAAFAVALLAGCAGPNQRVSDNNFVCAALGGLAGGAGAAAVGGSSSATAGGAAAGAILALVLCSGDDAEAAPMVEEPVCPMTPPPGALLDANGCAFDTDGDGVYDGIDLCRNTPEGVTVDRVGCPLDSDKDAVADYLDLCPGTPEGTIVDQDGCPLPGETLLSLTGVNFEFDKATLTPEAKQILEEAVTVLKDTDGIVEVRVEGHTDSIGTEEYNQKLSQARAEAVVEYLTSRGLDGRNLLPIGMGENFPVADNNTEAGRAANRRVDFVVNQ